MIWFNGRLVPAGEARIDPRDRGFTLGDGLFETLAVRDGEALRLADHLERMQRAAKMLELPVPVEMNELPAAIGELLSACDLGSGMAALRITLSRGVGSRGLLMPLDPKPSLVITATRHPPVPTHLDASVVTIRRNEGSPLSRIKSLNYLDNVLAQQEAGARGAGEGLLLNNAGRVAGFARGNVFVAAGNRLLTPPLADGVLDGIIRHLLLVGAQDIGMAGVEHSLGRQDLEGADGVFISNSLLGCVPIRRLDGRDLPMNPDLHRRLCVLVNA